MSLKNEETKMFEINNYVERINKSNKIIEANIKIIVSVLIFVVFLCFCYIISLRHKLNIILKDESSDFLDFKYQKIEPEKYYELKKDTHALLTLNDKLFINGVIRNHKPKKCIEVGTSNGGSSVIILNALKDIKGAQLYSMDLETKTEDNKKIGYIVPDEFPELLNKWKLYTGDVTSSFIEEIGGGIDFAFINSAHLFPSEMHDFLTILPFLKENAIVIIHDTWLSTYPDKIWNTVPIPNDRLFSYIRGKKFTIYNDKGSLILGPEDNMITGICGIILDKNQKKFFYSYFSALLTHWYFLPTEQQYKSFRHILEKYYKNIILLDIYDTAYRLNMEIKKKEGA